MGVILAWAPLLIALATLIILVLDYLERRKVRKALTCSCKDKANGGPAPILPVQNPLPTSSDGLSADLANAQLS